MRDKTGRSPQPNSSPHLAPYHRFTDRRHPDAYRQEDIQALKRAIRAKENRLVLGMPDIGLSNLLRFLVTRTDWGERTVTFAYLHCGTLNDCLDPAAFFAEMARQLSEQGLGNRLAEALPGYERLKALLTQVEADILDRVVIAVDKADKLLVQADEVFYDQLKALTDLNKGVCYIFVAGPQLRDVAGRGNPLFAGRAHLVGPFNERDFAGAVAEEGRRLEVEFDPAACQQLARLTGGQAGLLRAVSSAIVNEGLDLPAGEAELVEHLLTRLDVQHRCQKVWASLEAEPQVALRALVRGEAGLVEPDTLAWLRDFKLVTEHQGEYQLFSPIFQQFVANQAANTSLMEPVEIKGITEKTCKGQRVIVAGTVFKGNREVHVSSLELRLIACLKRERRVYPKDEIAAYVYCEDEEVGNIEAAIFNLVRQVRQRLGDKRYIKSHHGQGYEFCG